MVVHSVVRKFSICCPEFSQGNAWTFECFDKSEKGIAFNGSIDEFGIFESVYDQEQIRMIYEVGRPFEVPNALGSTLP